MCTRHISRYPQEKRELNVTAKDGSLDGELFIPYSDFADKNKNVDTCVGAPLYRESLSQETMLSPYLPGIVPYRQHQHHHPYHDCSFLMHSPYQRPLGIDKETGLKCFRYQGAEGPSG